MIALITLAAMLTSQTAGQIQERTLFQTAKPYSDRINSRADVAIVYGIDKEMPARVKSWRDRGYRIHLMTGVSWGEYQEYLYGRFDGQNHENEAQTESNGKRISHGGDVYYMSPGPEYGKFLCQGVQRALDAGVDAVHLEEPEFWERGGYGQGFKDEWQQMYGVPWQDPKSSPDARWRAAKLMYFLYRRALQQVFDYIQAYNKANGKQVRCYVPTHSLLNYAHWGIVSPESSLARLDGCDGYIAQVWTGTARTPNVYQGIRKERTFETAFLEYGSMQNLVRSTGRRVWYLADPVEDDASHDWGDYRRNWESTLTASLLQPEVWQYEVMPWPERIWNGKYPSEADKSKRVTIPATYETELQVVMNALKDMNQSKNEWDAGSFGIGVAVSDSLMFQRGGPAASDNDMSHLYGLAMPFLKQGMPIQPIQLENVVLPGYLNGTKVLLMSYEGMKPLTPEVHNAIADWVKAGGHLVFVDNDSDPFLAVREWWNTDNNHYRTPRMHLFEQLSVSTIGPDKEVSIGSGSAVWLKESPSDVAYDFQAASRLVDLARAAFGTGWRETSHLILRRGPYIVAAGLDETTAPIKTLKGAFIDLFDPDLKLQPSVPVRPGTRHFLVDLSQFKRTVIAAAGELSAEKQTETTWDATLEGIAQTQAILLLRLPRKPRSATAGATPINFTYDQKSNLTWLKFPNRPHPQPIHIEF